MAHTRKSPPTDDDPAEQDRGRVGSAPSPEAEGDDEEMTLAHAQDTLALASAWFSNLHTLIQLEFSRTLSASKQIVALSLLLLPLAVVLVLSICGGIGLIAYYFSQSLYAAFSVFVLTQVAVLAGILLYQRKLTAMLGFSETKRQTKEALNDVFGQLK